jgi:hypothetical protein
VLKIIFLIDLCVILIISACGDDTYSEEDKNKIEKATQPNPLKTSEVDKDSNLFFSHQDVFVSLVKPVVCLTESGSSLKMSRFGKHFDGGYIIPEIALESAEVLIGYGILNDNSFEDHFSRTYDRESIGFDCTVKDETVLISNPKFKLVKECIINSKRKNINPNFQNVSHFQEQIQKHGIEDKKLFIKMDIEGGEYDVMEDILQYASQITGIVLEVHIYHEPELIRSLEMLSSLREKFHLVHIHNNNCTSGKIENSHLTGEMSSVLEITMIHKSLVRECHTPDKISFPTPLDEPNCPYNSDFKLTINEI